MTELFCNPDKFGEYLTARIELLQTGSIVSPDEIDYLGLYIRNDDEFPNVSDDRFMMINDMSHFINQKIDYKFGM